MSGNGLLHQTLRSIAAFYDECKFGVEGCEGYRKSTDLLKFVRCAEALHAEGFLDPKRTVFADLGCADGRVNVLASYFVQRSLGIEIDPEILDEFGPRRASLLDNLRAQALSLPPENIALFAGSSLDESTYARIQAETGVGFEAVDLFYTYITLHDLFGEMIARSAKPGALYLVYGFNKVLPRYDGLELVNPDVAEQGIVALYRKPR